MDLWATRALVTVAAAELLRGLHADHGPLMFHQSGGCCDGSSPMCYTDGDFIVGDRDVLLGRVDVGADVPPVPVWISGSQFNAWKHTQIILDVVAGRGGGFSLEAPTGRRFLTRSRVIPAARLAELPDPLTGAAVEDGATLPDAYMPVELADLEGADESCAVVVGTEARSSETAGHVDRDQANPKIGGKATTTRAAHAP